MPTHQRTLNLLSFAVLTLVCVILVFSMATPPTGPSQAALLEDTPTPTTPPPYTLNIPLVFGSGKPAVELLGGVTSNGTREAQFAFLANEIIEYTVSGINNLSQPISATLVISHTGPVSAARIFSDTLSLGPGYWQQTIISNTQETTGVYTYDTTLSYTYYQDVTDSLSTDYVVNPPSGVIISDQAGFDRCYLPDIDEMAAWWEFGPYEVFNLYIGGIHFACDDQPLDPLWIQEVARQGWSYILTWVGPQAPCTNYRYRISYNTVLAYEQGRQEAREAAETAHQLGFLGDKIIYYDMEGYPDSSSCRNAVKEFMRGWVEQLHALEIKAGGYGSPCRSYLVDWASNDPPPDDVWIAHWVRQPPPWYYDPDQDVWSDGLCGLDNDLWSNHQRLKQYTGGHAETWGGETLVIDSNVLDGEITALQTPDRLASASESSLLLSRTGEPIQDLGLLAPGQGWVISGPRLRLTSDNGRSWTDITPGDLHPLDAHFSETLNGWAVGWSGDESGLSVARTLDGGVSWEQQALDAVISGDHPPVAEAYIQAVDGQNVFIAAKLQSGSNFSLGRLFASQDGGQTWQERSLPLGEPAVFLDELNGYTAGGPTGRQRFSTADGGYSWTEMDSLPSDMATGLAVDPLAPTLDTESAASLDSQRLPAGALQDVSLDGQHAWAAVQQGACQGDKLVGLRQCTQSWQLLSTMDGGLTWSEITPD